MAKGLGKGEEYEDQNPISFAQCLTITGFVFPCVIYLVGVIYFFTTNYEYLAVLEYAYSYQNPFGWQHPSIVPLFISRYNDKVSIWNSMYSSFENLTFSYDTAKYQADYSMPGENWPVRDNCFYMSKKNSDCIQTKGLFYTIDLPIEQYHPSYVYYNNEVLYQNDFPYVKKEFLNPQALHCSLEVEYLPLFLWIHALEMTARNNAWGNMDNGLKIWILAKSRRIWAIFVFVSITWMTLLSSIESSIFLLHEWMS